jgi:hypothetical protein
MTVAEDFSIFKDAYNISQSVISDISYRYRRITRQLNREFRNTDSETYNSMYVGSYGRDTAARGLSDLDVAYFLPGTLYAQYDAHIFNGQSALLQAVSTSVRNTYPTSTISGDGQVVVVSFTDGITFEILPCFINSDGTWTYGDSNNGGSWRQCNPRAEIAAISQRSAATNRNLKYLCRMMRVWRDHNNVPISGALIDTLAYQFIEHWEHRERSFHYHDYMARDFLAYLMNQSRTQTYWRMPGSASYVWKTGDFQSKASVDYALGTAACLLQTDNDSRARRTKWRLVFGSSFPS